MIIYYNTILEAKTKEAVGITIHKKYDNYIKEHKFVP